MDLLIIILNYNGGKSVLECLNSVVEAGHLKNTLLVDNGSNDESLECIIKSYPKLKVVKNHKNLGFAAGNNIGIKYALNKQSKAILLLNNDTTVSSKAIKYLYNNPADIVGAVLRFKRGNKIFFDLGGHILKYIGRTYHEEVTNINEYIYYKQPDYVSGAAMLVKDYVFKKIGYLDEDYFLYYEDTDFCVRAKRSGFNISVEPKSIIKHKLSATLGRKTWFTNYHNLKSNLLFIIKQTPFFYKPLALAYWVMLSIKVLINYLINL